MYEKMTRKSSSKKKMEMGRNSTKTNKQKTKVLFKTRAPDF